jgi:hypothetical protein
MQVLHENPINQATFQPHNTPTSAAPSSLNMYTARTPYDKEQDRRHGKLTGQQNPM